MQSYVVNIYGRNSMKKGERAEGKGEVKEQERKCRGE